MSLDERFERAIGLLESALSSCEPASLSGPEALALTAVLARGERLCSSGLARVGARVAETGAFHGDGHRDAASWLGSVTGESKGRATSLLSSVSALAGEPAAASAFSSGQLSVPQAEELAKVAPLGAAAVGEVLEATLAHQPLSALRTLAERVAARHRSLAEDQTRDEAQHAHRHLRTWRGRHGGLHGRFYLSDRDAARFLARVEPRAHGLAMVARSEKVPGEYEAWRADALMGLVTGAERASLDGKDVHTFVRIDADALRRGTVEGDECCEIPGLGPVSVATATSLMAEGPYEVVVADLVDVYAISRPARQYSTRQFSALAARDPNCVVPGCVIAHGLEIHHWDRPVIKQGRAELKNLVRVCKVHHHMLTHDGCWLEGTPGHWQFFDPRRDGGPKVRPANPGPGARAPVTNRMNR